MSGADLHKRFVQAIRSALVDYDGPGSNVIPARTFQAVLTSLGLALGNPVVDNIMLNCDILESGLVDVSRLLDVAQGANSDSSARVGAMTQAERVRNHSSAIHRAFIEFDSGRMSTEAFVACLQGLGIEQTLESRRVLRQIPVSFSTLLHALTLTDSTDITDQAAGSAHQTTGTTASLLNSDGTPGGPTRRHRGMGAYNGAHDRSTDVVTWKKDQLAINRGLDAKLWNTRALDYNTELWKGDVIAGVLVHNQEAPLERFETEAQHAALAGIGEPDEPLTSAGYQTADKGLLREQLYSLIRQLDQGAITISTFRQHLNAMHIDVPPRAERHLQGYAANGRVNFKEFVVAFEDYLAEATVHVQEPSRPTVAPAPTDPWWRTGGRGGKHNPGLQRGYGDIITWEHTSVAGVARDTTREHEKATFGRRLGFLYGGENRQKNFLAWEDNRFEPSERNKAPPRNNVITWSGPSLPEEADAGGRSLSIIGTHHRSRGCPYGTEQDYDRGVPLEKGIDGIPHKGTMFQPRDHNAVVGSAWGASATSVPPKSHASQNERDHIKRDFTVPAPAQQHGKRHYGAGVQGDHLSTRGGYLTADGAEAEEQQHHGKVMYGDRNVDHVRGLVGS